MTESTKTSLYAIWARKAPIGVILRRGPSKHVQLLKWNLETDQITPGQWFKGRIYERRCDLSPDGQFLIYFAANHKPPYRSWTAISRPPYISALALWPKGDAWGGGGLFDADDKGITLNHRSNEMKIAEGFKLPANFRVRPLGEGSGWGEDNPILSYRLERDGWVNVQDGKYKKNKINSKVWIEYVEPEIWEKKFLNSSCAVHLELHGIHEKQGSHYILHLKLLNDGETTDLGRCDWVDVNSKGVVYYSNQGALYRKAPDTDSTVVVDLSQNKFSELAPSPEALKW